MITMIKPVASNCVEIRAKSTDEKPIDGIGNGSVFYEMDTTDVYMFDGESKTWVKQ